MKRIIKDFKSTPPEILSLIGQQYPFGYDETHLVNFMNSKGEYFHALEVKTPESIYLIKQDRNLDQHISDFMNSEDVDPEVDEVSDADMEGEFETE